MSYLLSVHWWYGILHNERQTTFSVLKAIHNRYYDRAKKLVHVIAVRGQPGKYLMHT